MTTETDPRERPEIRTTDDLLTAVRVGLEIATRSDIHESEHRMMGRINERFDAQDRRLDTQDRRLDAQGARLDSFEARLNENTAAIRELKTLIEAERRGRDRAIQRLAIGFGALGALATAFAVITTLLGN